MSSFKNQEDIVQTVNGNFGKWQLRSIVLIFLCKIPTAWFTICVIYTAPTPQKGDYYCKPTESLQHNITSNLLENYMSYNLQKDIQSTDRQFQVDACHTFKTSLETNFAHKNIRNYSNPFAKPQQQNTHQVNVHLVPCDHFEHNSEYESLVTQFDLVCSRELLVSMTQSFHALGALIGGLVAKKALNHISPRRLMLYGMLGQIMCGNLTGLVTSFALHVYYRCLTSMFCAFMYTSGQVILTDITAGKARTIIVTLSELFWSIGLILLPGISIFFDSWSYLYIAISTSVILLVFLHRWISDSPRWLLKHNKIEQTLKLLLESAAFNNREIPLNLESQLQTYANNLRNIKESNYWSIWDGKTPRVFIVLIHWAWVVSAVLYNVMILMIRTLGVEHLHVNTACLGFAEMLGVFLGLYLILYTRHHWLWCGYVMMLAGFITYLIWFIPDTIKESRRIGFEMLFWILLKLANSAYLSILTTCTGQLVSPEKRSILMLSSSCFSRFWLIFAPFIIITTKIHILIPITVFASLAVSSGVLMCFLNIHFWNEEQPKICKIPTPNTYRRKSSTILLRRSSCISEMSSMENQSSEGGYDNPLTISITDLWHMDRSMDCIEEMEMGDNNTEEVVEEEANNENQVSRI
ncbi:solute carrier family 22 member 3 [Lucilia sericata]|uniref:solute carrier family 22 member 3 n=1 Tax=Lucilia sericata TaxID=13632 RepID=UPI0018A842EA|nr:solute carrier family 22 member 3 [Lucilia sericata]